MCCVRATHEWLFHYESKTSRVSFCLSLAVRTCGFHDDILNEQQQAKKEKKHKHNLCKGVVKKEEKDVKYWGEEKEKMLK